MPKKYKGREFQEIQTSSLVAGEKLAFDLYVFLPLNQRMLRVGELGQTIEQPILQRLLRHGHEKIYSLPGSSSDSSDEVPNAISLAEPSEALLSEKTEASARPLSETDSHPTPIEGEARENHETASTLVENFESSSLPEATFEEVAAETKEVFSEEIFNKSESTLTEENGDSPSIENFEAEKAESSEEQKTYTLEVEAKSEKTLIDAKVGAEETTTFAYDDPEEEEQAFDPEVAEKEAERIVKGNSTPPSDESKKISGSIKEQEEELLKFSSGSQDFVDEVRLLGSDSEKAKDWMRALAEDSPKLQGMSKEEKAAAKLAHALSKNLGLLRRELSGNNRGGGVEGDDTALAERRTELEKKIAKLEETSLILESLDDPEIQPEGLPETLKGKSRIELLGQLAEDLEGLKASELLSADDARLLDAKVKKIKSKDHAIHGEGVAKIRAEIEAKAAKAKKEGRALDRAEKEAANAQLSKEVENALMAKKITKSLARKREELTDLLQKKPQSQSERKSNEAKAKALQEEISSLNSLSFSVEAGEPLTESESKEFFVKPDEKFLLGADEDAGQGSERVLGELKKLQEDLAREKEHAAETEIRLMAAVNGTPLPMADPATPRDHVAYQSPSAAHPTVQSMAMNRIENSATPSAEAPDEPGVSESQKEFAEEAARSSMVLKMEKRISQLKGDLTNVLNAIPITPEELEERDANAAVLLKSVQGVEKIRDRLESGGEISNELAKKFNEEMEKYLPRSGETAVQAKARIQSTLQGLKNDSAQSAKESIEVNRRFNEALQASGNIPLQQAALGGGNLAITEKILARHLKSFLETGKNPDPKEVWEIKRMLATDVREARAEINIGKKLVSLSSELETLMASQPGSDSEREENLAKKVGLEQEILRLRHLGDSLALGREVDEKHLLPFTEDLEEVYRIEVENFNVEQITRVIDSLGAMKEELLTIKSEVIASLSPMKIQSLHNAPTPAENGPSDLASAEAELTRMVSGQDGKLAQAGVYAAAFLRSFGYESSPHEKDVVLAAHLWKYSPAQVRESFPETVAILHQTAHEPDSQHDLYLRDLAQAVRLASLYLEMPGVITGKFSVDPSIFANLCRELLQQGAAFDGQNLERARQASTQPTTESDRAGWVNLSRQAYDAVGKWKQTNAA